MFQIPASPAGADVKVLVDQPDDPALPVRRTVMEWSPETHLDLQLGAADIGWALLAGVPLVPPLWTVVADVFGVSFVVPID